MSFKAEDLEALGFSAVEDTYVSVEVEADVNDGDYIRETSTIDSLEDLKKVMEIAEKVMNEGGHNWEDNSYLSDDERELFDDYIPWMDNEYVHTIEDVTFTAVIDGKTYTA